MNRRAIMSSAAALAMLGACDAQVEIPPPEPVAVADPAAVIRPIYDPYLSEVAVMPELLDMAPWSSSMRRDLEALIARANANEEPALGFDPLIDAQDYQLNDLAVHTESAVPDSHAIVRASFGNSGQRTEVVYDMVWEGGAWRVDNVRTGAWDLRQIAAAP